MAVFFVVAVEMPVCIGFVSGSGLLGDLFLQNEDVVLELLLFCKQFGVDLGGGGGTSDMLGMWEARMSRPLRALLLAERSGLMREAVLSMGVLKSWLCLWE